jgi:hypothetical protein
VPKWAALIVMVLAEFTPETLAIIAASAGTNTGGSQEQMIRVIAAYDAACASLDS